MYCGKCGTEVEEGSRFCPHCGNKLSEGTDSGSAAEAGMQYAGSYQTAGYSSAEPNGDDGRIPGRGSAIASLVLGIIAVALWVFAAAFLVTILLSIVLGVLGLIFASNAKKEGYSGGIRTAGFVLSLIGVIGGAVLFIGCAACVGCIGVAGSRSVHF